MMKMCVKLFGLSMCAILDFSNHKWSKNNLRGITLRIELSDMDINSLSSHALLIVCTLKLVQGVSSKQVLVCYATIVNY